MCGCINTAGVITEHPASRTAAVGEWANFTCTINTSSDPYLGIRWCFVLPASIEVDNTFLKFAQLKNKFSNFGISMKNVAQRMSNNSKSETIMIYITEEMIGETGILQCVAFSTRERTSTYSKFAVLISDSKSVKEDKTSYDSSGLSMESVDKNITRAPETVSCHAISPHTSHIIVTFLLTLVVTYIFY